MPYVPQEVRPKLDAVVDLIADAPVYTNGELNYVLFAFCKRRVRPGYSSYKDFCGELRQCATEVERRLLAPYEDSMIEKNGDVI